MTKKQLAMEAAKLRLRIRMNNRLKLESQALLSRLFREHDLPIADELLGALVFAVPEELKVAANGPSNGVDAQKYRAQEPHTVRPAGEGDDDDDDLGPQPVRPDDDDDDKGPLPVRPDDAGDDDDDDDPGPQPVRPADDDDNDEDDQGPQPVRPAPSARRQSIRKAVGKKHLRHPKTSNNGHK